MSICIDLVRYPIDRVDTDAGAALVRSMQEALAEHGACELPGFLIASSVDSAVALAETQRHQAFRMEQEHDIEFSDHYSATLPSTDIHFFRCAPPKAPSTSWPNALSI